MFWKKYYVSSVVVLQVNSNWDKNLLSQLRLKILRVDISFHWIHFNDTPLLIWKRDWRITSILESRQFQKPVKYQSVAKVWKCLILFSLYTLFKFHILSLVLCFIFVCLCQKSSRLVRQLLSVLVGADPGFGRGARHFFWDLLTVRSTGVRAKLAYIGRGPGPTLGPWKLLHF